MTETQQERWIDAEVPEKLAFFSEWGRWRYKVARGGRGSAKSRTIATVLAARGAEVPLRWFCARETQKSQKFSSMQLIIDAIQRLGLAKQYTIIPSDNLIRGNQVWPDGRHTVFTFAGIREMSVNNIKSLEDFDGIWLAEAHELTKESWLKITPTFRKDDSEIWVDYNPEFTEDFIHVWCNDPPPRSKIVHVNYFDNPWFPKNLREEMEHMQKVDPEAYAYVWLGEARNNVIGAVYGKELQAAGDEKRIVSEPGIGIDRTKPVDTYWDLGHGDATAIWFCQSSAGWFNLVDYYENEYKDYTHYGEVLRSRGYLLGTCWLPWDGVSGRTHHKWTGSIERSPEQVMRSLGFQVRLAGDSGVDNGITAVRTIFPQLRFNEPKVRDGLAHLRRYQWGPKIDKNGAKMVQMKPQHDEHSHGADALRTLAVSAREKANSLREEDKFNVFSGLGGGGNGAGWRA